MNENLKSSVEDEIFKIVETNMMSWAGSVGWDYWVPLDKMQSNATAPHETDLCEGFNVSFLLSFSCIFLVRLYFYVDVTQLSAECIFLPV